MVLQNGLFLLQQITQLLLSCKPGFIHYSEVFFGDRAQKLGGGNHRAAGHLFFVFLVFPQQETVSLSSHPNLETITLIADPLAHLCVMLCRTQKERPPLVMQWELANKWRGRK